MLLKLVRKGLLELISANFLMQFVGFGLLVLLPRFVSEAEIGQIKVLQTYTDMLIIVGGLGMNTAVLKLCSERRSQADLNGLLRLATTRTIAWSVGVLAVVVLVARLGLLSLDPVVLAWLPVYGVIIPFAALTHLAAAWLQARKDIRRMARAQIIVKIQSVLLILLATWRFGLAGFVLSSVAAFAVGLWPYVRLIGTDFLRGAQRRVDAAFRSIAGFSVLGNVLNTTAKYADIYVLGLFATDATEVGYYALATIFVIPASVVTSSIQTVLTPWLSERAHDKAWFRRTVLVTQLQTVGVAVVVALVARVVAHVVISGLYDPGYAASLPYLDILLVFYVLRSAYAVTAAGHIAMGLTSYNFVASAFMAPLALGLTYLALSRFGFEGVAWAKVVAGAVMVFVYSLLIVRAIRRGPVAGSRSHDSPAELPDA